jgi:hypothetical protein
VLTNMRHAAATQHHGDMQTQTNTPRPPQRVPSSPDAPPPLCHRLTASAAPFMSTPWSATIHLLLLSANKHTCRNNNSSSSSSVSSVDESPLKLYSLK